MSKSPNSAPDDLDRPLIRALAANALYARARTRARAFSRVSMFSKKRSKNTSSAGRPSCKFPTLPLTPEHKAVLSEIGSPWVALVDPANSGILKEEIFRNALRSATEAQVAEFVFVVGRPATESSAVLCRGRRYFTEAAMSYALSFTDLRTAITDTARVIVGTVPATPGTRANPY